MIKRQTLLFKVLLCEFVKNRFVLLYNLNINCEQRLGLLVKYYCPLNIGTHNGEHGFRFQEEKKMNFYTSYFYIIIYKYIITRIISCIRAFAINLSTK